jgi:hypothetical protein
MSKHIDLSIRLVICANGVPAGLRLSRNLPLPHWQESYGLDQMELAEAHLERLRKYLQNEKNRK